jgi:hypothetical protein
MSIKSYSQNEFSNKFKAIPPVDLGFKAKKSKAPEVEAPAVVTPEVSKAQRCKTGSHFNDQNNFINPGDIVRDRLKERQSGRMFIEEIKT